MKNLYARIAGVAAVTAMLVLHVRKTGRQTVGRTPSGLHGLSQVGIYFLRQVYEC